MSKQIIHKLCYALSFLMVIAFIIALVRDYNMYSTTLNSAPFSLWIAVDSIYFLLPAGILFALGLFFQKNVKKETRG